MIEVNYAITAAIIGFFGALAGAAINTLVPRWLSRLDDAKRFYSSPKAPAVAGRWRGTGDDFFTEDGGEFLSFTLTLDLEVKGYKLLGRGELSGTDAELKLEGGFQEESYLQFSYQSIDPFIKQLGVIQFRLEDGGRVLKGHYAGYSPRRACFIAGYVTLSKIR